MATKIVTKNSSTAGSAPLASDLVQGELAVNVTDKRLYTENASGVIVEVGSNPYNFTANHDGSAKLATTSTGIDVTGTATMDGLTTSLGIDVNGTDDLRVRFLNGGFFKGGAQVATTSGDMITGSAVDDLAIRSQSNMLFSTGGSTERMRIDSSGNVGIGTSSPSQKLDVSGNISMSGAGTGARYVILGNETDTYAGSLVMQAGGGSAAYGGSIIAYGHSHASKAGDIVAGISSGSGGAFRVNTSGVDGGSDVLVVEASGNVGIGTTSPNYSLTSYKVGANANYLQVVNGSSGPNAGNGILYGLDGAGNGVINKQGAGDLITSVANSERMRIDSSGNVGIGTSSPTSRLQIDGAEDRTGGLTLSAGGQNHTYFLSSDFVNVHNIETSSGSAAHTWQTNGTERMRINASGNVEVKGGQELRVYRGDNATYGSMKYLTGSGGLQLNDKNGDGISFVQADGATEYMRIDSSGNLLVGTTTSIYNDTNRGLIEINGAANSLLALTVGGAEASYLYHTVNNLSLWNGKAGYLRFATNNAEVMRIDSSGNLLVGTTALNAQRGFAVQEGPATNVQIMHNFGQASGTTYAQFLYATAAIGSITQSGTTAVLYNTSSDQRLKENIADADDAGDKIDAIKVRQYDWKADGSHQDYGMIAQELQLVAPEAVSGDADSEEMMGVDYSKLVPMLIKEIQSLRNRVAQLEE